jgi:hypothetical protein
VYTNVTFAPDTHRKVLALVRQTENIGTLCLGHIGDDRLFASCLGFDGWSLGRSVSWAPNGRTILVFGTDPQDRSRFGIVRFSSKKAFSTNPTDWKSAMATNVTLPGSGVIAASFSPDGKQVAVVSNLGSSFFRVARVLPHDLDPTFGISVPVRACAVTWVPDQSALIIVQSDSTCSNPVGQIVRVSAANPRQTMTVAGSGTDPVFQSLAPLPGTG